ncbi:MAG TPA: hypothetical protein DCL48_12475, partial [Alphaproteobacteria bacterium]|nr:hypothetical protein [Alphaproteobacteria bacterium]
GTVRVVDHAGVPFAAHDPSRFQKLLLVVGAGAAGMMAALAAARMTGEGTVTGPMTAGPMALTATQATITAPMMGGRTATPQMTTGPMT